MGADLHALQVLEVPCSLVRQHLHRLAEGVIKNLLVQRQLLFLHHGMFVQVHGGEIRCLEVRREERQGRHRESGVQAGVVNRRHPRQVKHLCFKIRWLVLSLPQGTAKEPLELDLSRKPFFDLVHEPLVHERMRAPDNGLVVHELDGVRCHCWFDTGRDDRRNECQCDEHEENRLCHRSPPCLGVNAGDRRE